MRERDCIFFVLAHHKHYSDVLRSTGLIPRLAERYRIVVLTPHYDATRARERALFQHPAVTYQKLLPRAPRWWRISERYLRTFFVRELDYLAGVRIYDYGRYVNHLGHRLLATVGGLLPSRLLTAERMTRIESWLIPPARELRALISRHRPRLIVTATCGLEPLEAEAIITGRRLGIPTLAVDLNLDYPHYQSKRSRRTDYVSVWNPTMQREVEEYMHFPPERVRVTGCLRFDHYFTDEARGRLRSREAFLESKGLDPKQKTILWAATSSFFKHQRQLMQELLRARKSGELPEESNLLVRLHPGGYWEPYREFEGTPRVAIDFPGREPFYDPDRGDYTVEMDERDYANLTETLRYADVVMGVSTTLMLEAALFDKPSVAVGFPESMMDAYRSEPTCYFLSRGVMRLAKSPEELIRNLARYLHRPELDQEARLALARDYIPFTDGRTDERTVQWISEIAAHPPTHRHGS